VASLIYVPNFFSLHFVMKNIFYRWVSSIILLWFICFCSCVDPSIPYESLESKWYAYQDSLQSVFFIPSPENLQSHEAKLENFLSEIQSAEKYRGHDLRFDSLQLVVVEASQKYGRWYFDLEKYRVGNFLNEEMDSTIFRERIRQIPSFLESGKSTLQKENLSNIKEHIAHQMKTYSFLNQQNLLGYEKEIERARLSIKDFIAFLKSVKNNRDFKIEKTIQH